MKKFISKNWKTILIIIGCVFLAINLINKIVTSKTLLNDYIKYGKNIEAPEISENISETVSKTTSGIPADLIKYTIILIALILVVVIITNIGNKSSDKGKKK